MRTFSLEGKNYDYGTIMIPVANQNMDSESMEKLLSEIAKDSHIEFTGVSTGLTAGIDLGSNNFRTGTKSCYDCGWIYFIL